MLFHSYLIKFSPPLKCSTCSIFPSLAYRTPGNCNLDFFQLPRYYHPTSIPEWRVLIIAIILLVILLLDMLFFLLRILVLHDQNYTGDPVHRIIRRRIADFSGSGQILKMLIRYTPTLHSSLYTPYHTHVSSPNPYFQRNLSLVYVNSGFNCWKSSSR